jgi:hypothetical protein
LRRLTLTALCALPALTHAHDARPLAVTLLETTRDVYRVTVTGPPTLDAANLPTVVWPEGCSTREGAARRSELTFFGVVACAASLAGRTIRITYPLYNPALTTLMRLEHADGTRRSAVLPPDELAWTVPAQPNVREVAVSYTALGIEHIWRGFDHLLFVAGLVFLARTRRRILLGVTGFTVAHSITLSLAALGVVHVPIALIEALIALSIVFLARELALRDASSFAHRFPIAVSLVFGLLHGLGFAGALDAIGLPASDVAMGLIGFNVGVEIGQIAFIAALLASLQIWRAGIDRARLTGGGTFGALLPSGTAGYLLGVPATFWTLERTLAAFAG